MNPNDFTFYKEGSNIMSMGFNVKNLYAKNGLSVLYGGGKRREDMFFNKIHEYSIPMSLVMLNKQFDKYDVENISETIDLEDDVIKKMHLNEQGQNTLFDNLLKLSGPKSKTKKHKIKMKRFTRKKY
jgi:hypothetical protein